MITPTDTQQLLGLIIDQKLSLEQYPQLETLIDRHFKISARYPESTGRGTAALLAVIIKWEQGHQTASLEMTIDNAFQIELMLPIPPKQKEAKVVDLPDKDLPRIKKETTHVAGVINREMKQLQKKFPDHRFELSFEFQRLGRQKFYKIHIKTFKDEL